MLHLSCSDENGSNPKEDTQVREDPNFCSYMLAASSAPGTSFTEIPDGQPTAASWFGTPLPEILSVVKCNSVSESVSYVTTNRTYKTYLVFYGHSRTEQPCQVQLG